MAEDHTPIVRVKTGTIPFKKIDIGQLIAREKRGVDKPMNLSGPANEIPTIKEKEQGKGKEQAKQQRNIEDQQKTQIDKLYQIDGETGEVLDPVSNIDMTDESGEKFYPNSYVPEIQPEEVISRENIEQIAGTHIDPETGKTLPNYTAFVDEYENTDKPARSKYPKYIRNIAESILDKRGVPSTLEGYVPPIIEELRKINEIYDGQSDPAQVRRNVMAYEFPYYFGGMKDVDPSALYALMNEGDAPLSLDNINKRWLKPYYNPDAMTMNQKVRARHGVHDVDTALELMAENGTLDSFMKLMHTVMPEMKESSAAQLLLRLRDFQNAFMKPPSYEMDEKGNYSEDYVENTPLYEDEIGRAIRRGQGIFRPNSDPSLNVGTYSPSIRTLKKNQWFNMPDRFMKEFKTRRGSLSDRFKGVNFGWTALPVDYNKGGSSDIVNDAVPLPVIPEAIRDARKYNGAPYSDNYQKYFAGLLLKAAMGLGVPDLLKKEYMGLDLTDPSVVDTFNTYFDTLVAPQVGEWSESGDKEGTFSGSIMKDTTEALKTSLVYSTLNELAQNDPNAGKLLDYLVKAQSEAYWGARRAAEKDGTAGKFFMAPDEAYERYNGIVDRVWDFVKRKLTPTAIQNALQTAVSGEIYLPRKVKDAYVNRGTRNILDTLIRGYKYKIPKSIKRIGVDAYRNPEPAPGPQSIRNAAGLYLESMGMLDDLMGAMAPVMLGNKKYWIDQSFPDSFMKKRILGRMDRIGSAIRKDPANISEEDRAFLRDIGLDLSPRNILGTILKDNGAAEQFFDTFNIDEDTLLPYDFDDEDTDNKSYAGRILNRLYNESKESPFSLTEDELRDEKGVLFEQDVGQLASALSDIPRDPEKGYDPAKLESLFGIRSIPTRDYRVKYVYHRRPKDAMGYDANGILTDDMKAALAARDEGEVADWKWSWFGEGGMKEVLDRYARGEETEEDLEKLYRRGMLEDLPLLHSGAQQTEGFEQFLSDYGISPKKLKILQYEDNPLLDAAYMMYRQMESDPRMGLSDESMANAQNLMKKLVRHMDWDRNGLPINSLDSDYMEIIDKINEFSGGNGLFDATAELQYGGDWGYMSAARDRAKRGYKPFAMSPITSLSMAYTNADTGLAKLSEDIESKKAQLKKGIKVKEDIHTGERITEALSAKEKETLRKDIAKLEAQFKKNKNYLLSTYKNLDKRETYLKELEEEAQLKDANKSKRGKKDVSSEEKDYDADTALSDGGEVEDAKEEYHEMLSELNDHDIYANFLEALMNASEGEVDNDDWSRYAMRLADDEDLFAKVTPDQYYNISNILDNADPEAQFEETMDMERRRLSDENLTDLITSARDLFGVRPGRMSDQRATKINDAVNWLNQRAAKKLTPKEWQSIILDKLIPGAAARLSVLPESGGEESLTPEEMEAQTKRDAKAEKDAEWADYDMNALLKDWANLDPDDRGYVMMNAGERFKELFDRYQEYEKLQAGSKSDPIPFAQYLKEIYASDDPAKVFSEVEELGRIKEMIRLRNKGKLRGGGSVSIDDLDTDFDVRVPTSKPLADEVARTNVSDKLVNQSAKENRKKIVKKLFDKGLTLHNLADILDDWRINAGADAYLRKKLSDEGLTLNNLADVLDDQKVNAGADAYLRNKRIQNGEEGIASAFFPDGSGIIPLPNKDGQYDITRMDANQIEYILSQILSSDEFKSEFGRGSQKYLRKLKNNGDANDARRGILYGLTPSSTPEEIKNVARNLAIEIAKKQGLSDTLTTFDTFDVKQLPGFVDKYENTDEPVRLKEFPGAAPHVVGWTPDGKPITDMPWDHPGAPKRTHFYRSATAREYDIDKEIADRQA